MGRHPSLVWAKVQARLEAYPDKLWSLAEMERTGGEPDVVGQDKKSGEYVLFDCSTESPEDRTSFIYDREGLDAVHQTRSNLFGWRGQFAPEFKPLEYERFSNCGGFAIIGSPALEATPVLNSVEFDGFGIRAGVHSDLIPPNSRELETCPTES